MKILKFENLEIIKGGGKNRDCMIRGVGIAVGVLAGLGGFVPGFFMAGGVASTSSHCFEL
nr:hypothetical protein [uncultured Chryseobacterium sp.]